MRETYVRFVIARRDDKSDQLMGIFTALYEMQGSGEFTTHELEWFTGVEHWFNKNLKRPDRLSWSTRPNAPMRAISWLKMSAKTHLTNMRDLVVLLRYKDVEVEELRTDKPGYVVYEDEHQVVAIPFGSETM